jgi:hypothetical protein
VLPNRSDAMPTAGRITTAKVLYPGHQSPPLSRGYALRDTRRGFTQLRPPGFPLPVAPDDLGRSRPSPGLRTLASRTRARQNGTAFVVCTGIGMSGPGQTGTATTNPQEAAGLLSMAHGRLVLVGTCVLHNNTYSSTRHVQN